MTYAAFFRTFDGFVAIADGWAQYEEEPDDYSVKKVLALSLPGGTDAVCAYSGRARIGSRTIREILEGEALSSTLGVAVSSTAAYARRAAYVLGDLAEDHDHTRAKNISLLVGFGSDPAWHEVEITAGGLCNRCTPGTPGQQSIGAYAQEIEPELLKVLTGQDTTVVPAETLRSLLPTQLQRMWRADPQRFTNWGVGGTFTLMTLTEGRRTEDHFSLDSSGPA